MLHCICTIFLLLPWRWNGTPLINIWGQYDIYVYKYTITRMTTPKFTRKKKIHRDTKVLRSICLFRLVRLLDKPRDWLCSAKLYSLVGLPEEAQPGHRACGLALVVAEPELAIFSRFPRIEFRSHYYCLRRRCTRLHLLQELGGLGLVFNVTCFGDDALMGQMWAAWTCRNS